MAPLNTTDLDEALANRLARRTAEAAGIQLDITDTYRVNQAVPELYIEAGQTIVFLNAKPTNAKLLAEAMEMARAQGIEDPYFMVKGSDQHKQLLEVLGAGKEA